MGTYGSRSLAVGGSAIVKAMDKVVAKGRKIAAHLLEAAEADIEFKDGRFRVAGTDREKTLAEIALTAYVPHNFPHRRTGAGSRRNGVLRSEELHISDGAHIAEIEIDPDTGHLEVVNFTAADDFGRIINPMIVAGQVHGGLAQGIGQAVLEDCVYDKETGQLLTGSYKDYAMPRADDFPDSSCRPTRRCAPTTRSASKAAERPARSGPRRRSPTRLSMRCRRSVSAMSRCRPHWQIIQQHQRGRREN